MFILYAKKNILEVKQKETVTSGSVNVYTVQFNFNEDWNGLVKTAVFKVGNNSAAVLLDDSNECTIPWEVLDSPMRPLEIGVYGTKDAEIVLPTIWANAGEVKQGTIVRESTIDPTPSLMDQLLDAVNKKGDGLDYDGFDLKLLSGDNVISSVPLIGGTGGDVVTGVTAFNGRRGNVTPQAGDYTAEMVGALPADTVIPTTAEQVGALPDTTVIPSTPEQVGADPAGTAEEKVTMLKNELVPQIEDKISASGDVMSGPLQFSAGNTETVARSGASTGAILMETDGLHLQSSTNAINVNNSVLRGVASGVQDNDVTTVGQLENAVTALETSINEIDEKIEAVSSVTEVSPYLYAMADFPSDDNTNAMGTNTILRDNISGKKPIVGARGTIFFNQGSHLYYNRFEVTALYDTTVDIKFTSNKVQIDTHQDISIDIGRMIITQKFLPDNMDSDVGGTCSLSKNNTIGNDPEVDQQGIAFIHQHNHLYYNRFKVTEPYDENGFGTIQFISKKTQIDTDTAPGILLYGSVVDSIVKNQSTTVTENFFIGPLPQVNDAGYGLLEQGGKLYRVAYHVSSISPTNLFTIVYDSDPELIGPNNISAGSNELITIKDTKVTNVSQLPEYSCCVHAINSDIGFTFRDDIVYLAMLGSEIIVYTIDGSFTTINVDSDTGNLTISGTKDDWAKASEVYNKTQVDEKIQTIELTPGPAGADGTNGTDGLDALILNATFTSTPAINTDYLINRTWINREPVKGEVISGTVTDDKAVVYWVVGKVISASSSPYSAKFSTVTKLTGPKGDKGQSGTNGVSPTITIAPNTNSDGTTVTITDVNGSHAFDILNGLNGEDGVGVPTGGTTGQVLAKSSDADYATQWVDATQNGGSVAAYLVNAPIGVIMGWSGTYENVPEGWSACNGENGTLDLRDKFILGAGTNHSVGDTGGSEEVALTLTQIPSHKHLIPTLGDVSGPSSNSPNKLNTEVLPATSGLHGGIYTEVTGRSEAHSNMPPYYALLFIQKVSSTPSDYMTEAEVTAVIQEAINAILPGSNVPTGGIIIWSGASTAVPSGWALCDGTNGTPDLRGRFVLGENEDHAHGKTGGSEKVTLTVEQMPSHRHTLSLVKNGAANGNYDYPPATSSATAISVVNDPINATGSSQPHSNMPPYYVLAYIMKL